MISLKLIACFTVSMALSAWWVDFHRQKGAFLQTVRALSLIPATPLAFLFSVGACRLKTVAAQGDSNILGVFIVASILPIALGILIGKMVSWRYSEKASACS